MNAREYLKRLDSNTQVTFVVQHSVPSAHGHFCENRYSTTPVRQAWDWLRGETFGSDLLVVNPDHPPIDATGAWCRWYREGQLRCLMVTTEADLLAHYGETQGSKLIAYYERLVK